MDALRAAKRGAKNPMSYCSTFEECEADPEYKAYLEAAGRYIVDDPGLYATSMFPTVKSTKRFLKATAKKNLPRPTVVRGEIRKEDGPSSRDGKEHVSWWLYKHAKPWEYFYVACEEELNEHETDNRNRK